MILIAESGSTKTDWLLSDETEDTIFQTIGLNPFFHDEEKVKMEITTNKSFFEMADKVKKIYFFGAGCSSKDRNQIIENGLASVFTNAEINVNHDIIASAIACCGNENGFSVIMGTGSNSCFWDGKSIYQEVPALGYILGDEGSGSYFGKALLSSFIYKQLPAKLNFELEENQKLTKEIIFENVYKNPNANVYLASFTKILSNYRDEIWVQNLLKQGFSAFVKTHLLPYTNIKSFPIHFVGSVACNFSDELKKVLLEFELTPGKFINNPILELKKYFNK